MPLLQIGALLPQGGRREGRSTYFSSWDSPETCFIIEQCLHYSQPPRGSSYRSLSNCWAPTRPARVPRSTPCGLQQSQEQVNKLPSFLAWALPPFSNRILAVDGFPTSSQGSEPTEHFPLGLYSVAPKRFTAATEVQNEDQEVCAENSQAGPAIRASASCRNQEWGARTCPKVEGAHLQGDPGQKVPRSHPSTST